MSGRIGRAAALIAVLTIASRLAGFLRTFVLARSVGDTDLGDVYVLANTIPNIVFEIVVGGAAAAMVVPLLAGAVAADDRAAAGRVTSALLTWMAAILVPLAVVAAVAAPLIVAAVADAGATAQELDTATRMLRIFAVQVPLYGVGVVLTGVLQAYRRFAWPALAPLLSSVVVIGAYLLFAAVDGRARGLDGASDLGIAILAYGTTLGVVVLSGCLIPPVLALRVRLRPTWSFDNPSAVRSLALAGAATVGAQQVSLIVGLKLALAGPAGTALLFNVAQTVYLLPWAILAVPLATAAYPTLALAVVGGDEAGYRSTLARTARSVVLLSCLGQALLVGVAGPAAAFLVEDRDGNVARLAAGIASFAPGLVGYGLMALLTRALYARHRQRDAAVATLIGWGVAAVAMLILAAVLPSEQRLVAIGLGTSLGMLVLAGVLLGKVGGLPGFWRAAGAGELAALAGAVAGILVVTALGHGPGGGGGPGAWVATVTGGLPSAWPALIAVGAVAALAVAVVFTVVAALIDGGDTRTMASGVWSRLRRKARGMTR
ncbi:putative peptidoglycan lipid II flippase [Allocatelliglobosispora scoriae]|uniref:Putative peptidoglycan lipid II flippase n=1 Tax=Allocatelliglobosispora scoriae TaxID=643052 RepID=A0A841C0E9_9ACTN|nr:lipid II flippase MurJ [Allocatelliglobosispora scoriae]MBB5873218.1 putative peptidoglycan lipid II flippase [Allocatelliglobosispora scoriae]